MMKQTGYFAYANVRKSKKKKKKHCFTQVQLGQIKSQEGTT